METCEPAPRHGRVLKSDDLFTASYKRMQFLIIYLNLTVAALYFLNNRKDLNTTLTFFGSHASQTEAKDSFQTFSAHTNG